MKKFNSWLNESKFEEKNIIKEEYTPTVISPSVGNPSKMGSEKIPFFKYQDKVNDLRGKHASHVTNSRYETKKEVDKAKNRSTLINMLGLLVYEDKEDFIADWNYVKNHMSPELDNSDLNVDRK